MAQAIQTNDYIIDENSEQIEQPEGLKINLKPHQLALINKMLHLEDPAIKNLGGENLESFKTDFGAICDKVGAGKSLTVLGLITQKPFIEPEDKCLASYGNMVHLYSKTELFIPINIIVVPLGIVKQWEQYIEKFTSLKNLTIKSKKVAFEFIDKLNNFRITDEEKFDMNTVIISSSQYNNIAKSFTGTIGISRLIVDEVDSIKIPSSWQIKAEFTWFISSSVFKIQNPRGHYVAHPYTYTSWAGEEINTIRQVCVDKMTHSGFFRNLLIELERLPFKNQIFLKSKDEFVENSFNLPSINYHLIKCKGNLYVNVLDGLVSQDVMNMINAGDIKSAVETIGCDTKDEKSLIKIVTKDLEKNLKNKIIEFEAKEKMDYSNQSIKIQALEKLKKDIKTIEEKISSIKDRVANTNACPICCDEINNKVILKCCNNAFCLECITLSLNHKPSCPLCRKMVGKKDLIVIQENIEEKKVIIDDDSKRSKLENLIKYLEDIIQEEDRKILIFSEYEQSFDEIEKYLIDTDKKYEKLKGSSVSINNKVKNYKEKDTNILLLNSKYFGTGLNLENTTDIFLFHKMTESMEKQVVGRAQRPGRKNQLNVLKLCYENEM